MYSYQWIDAADDLTEDVPALVVEVSRTDPFIGLPPDPAEEDVRELTARLRSGIASGRTHLLTIRTEAGRTIGCVALSQPPTKNQGHIAELTTGAIHPEHRGGGLVSRAFAEVGRRCQQRGIELLRLDVREGIPAERIWRQFGFTEYGRLPDYGRVGAESYAGIYLAQPVAQLMNRISNQEA
ncbi:MULTISPECIES: GNAT family N-acetyltransferase [unclassified Streptomyces]|uniref:GNAT family N-acetyltransferase n=1 Tax=unclassified Streptomyces TaxID=2593676 RepID=UPI0037A79BEE